VAQSQAVVTNLSRSKTSPEEISSSLEALISKAWARLRKKSQYMSSKVGRLIAYACTYK
jgi:hypothetical protein